MEGMGSALRHAREEIFNLYRGKTRKWETTGLLECFCSVGDYEIQRVLRQLESETLAAALAGASGEEALGFLSNLSDRILYAVNEDIQRYEGSEEESLKAQRKVLEIWRLCQAGQDMD